MSQSLPSNRTLIVATAGHVDHGKSTLVKALTGTDTDTLAEEIKRGLTINLGYAYDPVVTADGETLLLGFVDVPGHTDFINNMLAGVAAVQCALLVVAADDGVMPQTREHLAILDLLGFSQAVVALTKIDRCTNEQVQQCSQQVRDLLADTALAEAVVLPVSSLSGDGIEALRSELLRLDEEKVQAQARHDRGFRFLIDRSFSVRGIGTVVTGTATAGLARQDEEFLHSGSGQMVRLRGIRLHETELQALHAGQRAAVNITLPQQQLHRGDWLLTPSLNLPQRRADVQLQLIDASTTIQPGRQYHFYTNANHRVVTLRRLGNRGSELYQIQCQEPLFLHSGDRFIVRDPADRTTLGGGSVLDIFVPARHRDSDLRREQLKAQRLEPTGSLQRLLETEPGIVNLNRFCLNRNLSPHSTEAMIESLGSSVRSFLILTGASDQRWLLATRSLAKLTQSLQETLGAYHRENPSRRGLGEADLIQSSGLKYDSELMKTLIEHLVDSDSLARTGSMLHLIEHRVQLSTNEKQFLEKIRPLLADSGWVPPRTRELVEQTGIPLGQLETTLRDLARNRRVTQVADNRYYLTDTLWEIAGFTEKLARDNPEGFTVIQFRDTSGIGRNLCIEILEYFDGLGFTQRRDNVRLLRKSRSDALTSP